MDSEYALKTELVGVPDRLGAAYKRKRGDKDDSKGFGSSNWQGEAALHLTRDGRLRREQVWGGCGSGLQFGMCYL